MKIVELINKNLKKLENIDFSEYKHDEKLVQETIDYLYSEQAFESIGTDPYWPKWDSPWWRMTLLHEMGLTKYIPSKIIQTMIEKIDSHYLHFFPFVEEEIPEGKDPFRHIICHCGLGTMYKILNGYGIKTDEKYPWIREWFLTYQQKDGGLNCDEAVYTKHAPKSSVISTLPPLEAMLFYAENKNSEELDFLDRGAEYLIKRKLFRNSTTQEIIDNNWTKLFFPRFYEYDILRGLSFLTEWALQLNKELPMDSVIESLSIIDSKVNDEGYLQTENTGIYQTSTLYSKKGIWERKPAETFPLMDDFLNTDVNSFYLTKEWNRYYKKYESITKLSNH